MLIFNASRFKLRSDHIFLFFLVLLQVVRDEIAAGVDDCDSETKKEVRKAAHGLLLTRETAMSIASKILLLHAVSVVIFT